MKKIYSFLTVMVSAIIFAQTTIYTENFGNPAATTLVPAYTGYQAAAPVVYTGTADVRTSTPSTGYTGASGEGCVFIGATTSNPVKSVTISGISTEGYENLVLSFGHQKSTNASTNQLLFEVSEDGTNFTPLSYVRAAGNSLWVYITATGNIPTTPTLSIRITNPLNSNVGFRVDDLKLVGTLKALAVSNTNKTKFNVYPTMVNNGVLFITSDSNAVKNVKIYDQTSKLVINTSTKKEVNVEKLTKGIYIVSVEENGVVESKKISIK